MNAVDKPFVYGMFAVFAGILLIAVIITVGIYLNTQQLNVRMEACVQQGGTFTQQNVNARIPEKCEVP